MLVYSYISLSIPDIFTNVVGDLSNESLMFICAEQVNAENNAKETSIFFISYYGRGTTLACVVVVTVPSNPN